MKSDMKVINGCQRQLKLEASVEEILTKYDKVYGQLQKVAQVPGFRLGKAPRHILEQHFSDKAKEEVLSQLITKSYQKAVEQNSLEPVTYPEISDIKFEKNKPLYFTAKVDVKPEIKLKNYKGIKVKKKKIDITPEEINKALSSIRENLSVISPVLEDRELREGDFILADIECFVDGVCIDKRQDTLLFLSEKDTKPAKDNFVQQLFGAKIGQIKKVAMALPKDYHQAKYASRQAEFNISIKQIKKKELPALDDTLAKAVGNYKTLEELKEVIKQDLLKKKEVQAKLEMEQSILENLSEHRSFAVPASLVTKRLDYLIDNAQHKLEQQGFKKEDIEKQKQALEEKLKPEAEKQVKLYFILNKIAQIENLKVTPQDLEREYQYLSQIYGKSLEEIKKEISEHNLVEDLKEELLRGRSVDFLVKEARIEETS